MRCLTFRSSFLLVLLCVLGEVFFTRAQGVDVPVYSRDRAGEKVLRAAAEKLRAAGRLVRESVLTNQFNRKSCELVLAAPDRKPLASRELWSLARAAHLRVGWYFLCTECGKWHLNLGAGYALTHDGAVATCFHVVQPPKNLKEGYLIAADEAGTIYPATGILAANATADAAIIRIQSTNLTALALNTEVYPGDRCVCFSDPLGENGYYSDGIVSRFLNPRERGKGVKSVTRLNVTTDWAPGSSGSAVLDECGNAIGHVTSIATLTDHAPTRNKDAAAPTWITIHEAVSARDVLSLVHRP